MENTLENKAKFFAQYLKQEVVVRPEWKKFGLNTDPLPLDPTYLITGNEVLQSAFLQLKTLQSITDEDAIEVATLIHGESDNFEIEFNASGITSVSPYGLPCYGNTVDIGWNGDISYERGINVDVLSAYQYLQSKGYALPFMGLSVEDQINYGWLRLSDK